MMKPSSKTDLYFALFFTVCGSLFLYLLWTDWCGLPWLLTIITVSVLCTILSAWFYVVTRPYNPAYEAALLHHEQDKQDFHDFVSAMDEDRYWSLCDEVRPEAFGAYLFEIYEREAKPNGAKYTAKPVCLYP